MGPLDLWLHEDLVIAPSWLLVLRGYHPELLRQQGGELDDLAVVLPHDLLPQRRRETLRRGLEQVIDARGIGRRGLARVVDLLQRRVKGSSYGVMPLAGLLWEGDLQCSANDAPAHLFLGLVSLVVDDMLVEVVLVLGLATGVVLGLATGDLDVRHPRASHLLHGAVLARLEQGMQRAAQALLILQDGGMADAAEQQIQQLRVGLVAVDLQVADQRVRELRRLIALEATPQELVQLEVQHLRRQALGQPVIARQEAPEVQDEGEEVRLGELDAPHQALRTQEWRHICLGAKACKRARVLVMEDLTMNR
mmetsp:Transcript_7496/g.19170  ORF Transcript_7496/g.19170 Transcript_7496/m.19170 type:complete len:308 (-) Transcript_7496:208-1131(-)